MTSIPEVPGSNSEPGSSALGQGTLSSLASLSEETLSCCIYRRVIPYARKRTHFTSRKVVRHYKPAAVL